MKNDTMINEQQQQREEYMECSKCESFAKGCEAKCPYELPTGKLGKPSRLKTRQAMKVEKSREKAKAKVKSDSASSKLAQMREYGGAYYKALHKAEQANKELEKATAHREKRQEKNKKMNTVNSSL